MDGTAPVPDRGSPARHAHTRSLLALGGFHVLIVADKYQTGFDQPLLHTMYVTGRTTLKCVRAAP
jgi:hypothetical protein